MTSHRNQGSPIFREPPDGFSAIEIVSEVATSAPLESPPQVPVPDRQVRDRPGWRRSVSLMSGLIG